jgi:cation:H+ antiporter
MFPAWILPALLFSAALGVALRAAAWFTRLLEDLGDRWGFSPGLLSFLSALGANIPNYGASLVAFAGGHGSIGLGIIVGSNIYNLAIILGLVTFAIPGGHGITLDMPDMRDARRITWLVAAMGATTWLTVLWFTSPPPWPMSISPFAAPAVNALTLALFLGLLLHAVQRVPHPMALSPGASLRDSRRLPRSVLGLLARCLLALAIAMAGVIVMVQAGQVGGADLHLPPAILSVVVLAVATSVPNTVVAIQLARTTRASTCVEEIVSSNGINLALGSALPALLWSGRIADPSLLRSDLPLLCVLGLVVAALVEVRRIPPLVGTGLFGVYALWVVMHILM